MQHKLVSCQPGRLFRKITSGSFQWTSSSGAGRSNREGIKLSVLMNFLYSSLNICSWLLLRTEYSARWTFGLTQCGSSYIFMCSVTASSVTVELHKTPLWIYVHLKENWGKNLRRDLSLSPAVFSEHKLLLWNSEAASSSAELCAASFQRSIQHLHARWFQESAWSE